MKEFLLILIIIKSDQCLSSAVPINLRCHLTARVQHVPSVTRELPASCPARDRRSEPPHTLHRVVKEERGGGMDGSTRKLPLNWLRTRPSEIRRSNRISGLRRMISPRETRRSVTRRTGHWGDPPRVTARAEFVR